MRIGIPKERRSGEKRVSLVPESVKRLISAGHQVVVEVGAGVAAGYPDGEYAQAGATLGETAAAWEVELVAKVERPLPEEYPRLRPGLVLLAMLQHLSEPDLVGELARRGVTAFAMDWMPRITRAQDMDARSSMSTVQGYEAVVLGAELLPRMMPMLMTAAGTVAPARVLVIGAGVAGLSAIATARRLGAVVEGFDVRPATREQVESLGARFVAMDAELANTQDAQGYATAQSDEIIQLERQTLARRLPSVDLVIPTALVPGQKPPLLLTRAMVESMRPGSVIVDVAAPLGGNCELTRPGEVVEHAGVRVVGVTDLESRKAYHASQMYSRNVVNYLNYLFKGGTSRLAVEEKDELMSFPLVTHAGEVRHGIGGRS